MVALVALLAACGGQEPPNLVIPTLAATADPNQPPTATTIAAVSPTALPTVTLPAPPTTVPPTMTLAPTALPPATPTPAPPTPTLAPTATAVPPEVGVPDEGYRVAFVAANDVLNVRRRPGSDAPIVGELAPNATGIEVVGEGQTARGGGLWLPVDTAAVSGYVNSRFLTESVSREAFCADPAVTELLGRLQTAIADQDEKLLRELVHPTRGLRLRHSWWNEEVILREDDLKQVFKGRSVLNWGTNEGSGEPLRGTFGEVMLPLLEKDLLGATQWSCAQMLYGPTAGMIILPEGYEAVHFYSAYRPAPAAQEFDWGTWAVGVERWEGRYYISYLVHYRYEI